MSTKTERTELVDATDHACAACPWRVSNQGRKHPGNWYSKANRRRLWNGLRSGDAPGMTCHPTDPENQPVAEHVETRECAGAVLLLAREWEALGATLAEGGGVQVYQRSRPKGTALTKGGAAALGMRLLLGGTMLDGRPGLRDRSIPDDPDVQVGLP